MTNIDFTPLFRTAVGFDRMASMLEQAERAETNGYPPYNIEQTTKDGYRISIAVAGFTEEELDIQVNQNKLSVVGKKQATGNAKDRVYLHRGIATRSFDRQFQLADFVKVTDANIENGLLHIDLLREIPDSMKPRRIQINKTDSSPVLDDKNEAA